MIKHQQSQALTSRFESFWSIVYFEFDKKNSDSSSDEARQMTNVMFNLLEMTPSLRIIMGRSCLKPIKFIVVSQTVSFHLTIIPFRA